MGKRLRQLIHDKNIFLLIAPVDELLQIGVRTQLLSEADYLVQPLIDVLFALVENGLADFNRAGSGFLD